MTFDLTATQPARFKLWEYFIMALGLALGLGGPATSFTWFFWACLLHPGNFSPWMVAPLAPNLLGLIGVLVLVHYAEPAPDNVTI